MALKLVSDPHVRDYELTYLLSPDSTEADLQAVQDDISKFVTKHKGEVKKTDNWGKKDMAYAIPHEGKTYRQAVYVHHVIQLPAAQAPTLDREVQLDTRIIRHLLVVSEAEAEE